jgi:gamma-glutamyltranspeptidase / glutathione hydrolase
MKRRFIFLIALLSSSTYAQFGPLIESAPDRGVMVAVPGTKFMVASANPLASAAGKEILKQGGSAVDATIAIELVLSLVEPQSSGVGGGGFALVYDAASGKIRSYDGRETAPASASANLFLGADGKPVAFIDSYQGGRPVGIPGLFRLMEILHKNHGKLKWRALFQPAIRLAEKGFVVSPRLHMMLDNAKNIGVKFPALKSHYFDANGEALAAGAVLKDADYAKLLRAVAKNGAAYFYEGPPAEAIIAAVGNSPVAPVAIIKDDFKNYQVVERNPVCAAYRKYKICSMGPPSSGASTLIASLAILEKYNLQGLGAKSANSIHLIAEALAISFADRDQYIADPAFVTVPLEGLLDPNYLEYRGKLLDPLKAGGPVKAGNPPTPVKAAFAPGLQHIEQGTSHLSVVDGQGNTVALTQTVQAPFGSFLRVNGFLLNNELTDFSFVPMRDGLVVANNVEPGKRPRSSMSPTIVLDEDNKPVLSIGSAGGARIIAHTLKTLIAVLDWNMDIQSAISYPNFFKTTQSLEIEPGEIATALKAELTARGHTVIEKSNVSGLQGIQIVRSAKGVKLFGGADPHREGVALGE